ncbi:sensor histidine kinase [Marinactinospora thermotolerans]|uniref:histidine kinase n=1 Tax=Marinactinospora thermotolerans DSM 45154 TaxID=1122192 RepID=A0A1T4T755_9ACTN|nr:histidine kinase [Marinactinospora thermotolerans]SKA36213.1 Signal transduction histidine kinase [Marinactinospora thermotolerans DSM 45154]
MTRGCAGSAVQLWEWGWERRYRIADWCYAVWFLPFVAVMNLVSPAGGALLLDILDANLPAPVVVFLLLQTGLVFPLLVSAAILFRRSRPVWLLGIAAAALFLFSNVVPTVIAIYSYAVWSTDRRSLSAWSGVLAVGIVWAYHGNASVLTVSILIMALVLPLLVGLWFGTRRQLVANLRERAERLEREQHLMAESAIIAERSRIAREMHDVVAHRVSLMVLHAGGLEVSAPDERTAETAGLIRTTGREALAELREILGVLRAEPDGAPMAPQPVLADLPRLIADSRAAGMTVEHHTSGRPRPLSAQAERTAYRVVQEALTNAGKHARGGAVTVRVHYGEADLEVVVANEPPPEAGVERPPSGGYGLTGLRERVELAGGTLTAGPRFDGTWQVRAIVPVTGSGVPR